MSLQFIGPRGSFEVRWVTYALLRDGVLHHLEKTGRDPRFAPLHAISRALGGRGVRISALGLRRAVLDARSALYQLPSGSIAVSPDTLSVISGVSSSGAEATKLLTRSGPAASVLIDPTVTTFRELISPIVEPLLSVTEGTGENDVVEVNDL